MLLNWRHLGECCVGVQPAGQIHPGDPPKQGPVKWRPHYEWVGLAGIGLTRIGLPRRTTPRKVLESSARLRVGRAKARGSVRKDLDRHIDAAHARQISPRRCVKRLPRPTPVATTCTSRKKMLQDAAATPGEQAVQATPTEGGFCGIRAHLAAAFHNGAGLIGVPNPPARARPANQKLAVRIYVESAALGRSNPDQRGRRISDARGTPRPSSCMLTRATAKKDTRKRASNRMSLCTGMPMAAASDAWVPLQDLLGESAPKTRI